MQSPKENAKNTNQNDRIGHIVKPNVTFHGKYLVNKNNVKEPPEKLSAILGISVIGNPLCNGESLRAILEATVKQFGTCKLLIGDWIQTYNLIMESISEEELREFKDKLPDENWWRAKALSAYAQAIELGQQWWRNNAKILFEFVQGCGFVCNRSINEFRSDDVAEQIAEFNLWMESFEINFQVIPGEQWLEKYSGSTVKFVESEQKYAEKAGVCKTAGKHAGKALERDVAHIPEDIREIYFNLREIANRKFLLSEWPPVFEGAFNEGIGAFAYPQIGRSAPDAFNAIQKGMSQEKNAPMCSWVSIHVHGLENLKSSNPPMQQPQQSTQKPEKSRLAKVVSYFFSRNSKGANNIAVNSTAPFYHKPAFSLNRDKGGASEGEIALLKQREERDKVFSDAVSIALAGKAPQVKAPLLPNSNGQLWAPITGSKSDSVAAETVPTSPPYAVFHQLTC